MPMSERSSTASRWRDNRYSSAGCCLSQLAIPEEPSIALTCSLRQPLLNRAKRRQVLLIVLVLRELRPIGRRVLGADQRVRRAAVLGLEIQVAGGLLRLCQGQVVDET